MGKTAYRRFLCVRDGFHEDPLTVCGAAQGATYIEHEIATGLCSSTVHHEPGVKQKLERLLGLKITRWDTDPTQENGVFYIGAAQGCLQEKPGIRADDPHDDVTAISCAPGRNASGLAGGCWWIVCIASGCPTSRRCLATTEAATLPSVAVPPAATTPAAAVRGRPGVCLQSNGS